MNKCPRCLNPFSTAAEVCPECGFSLIEDITETLSRFGFNETQATKILAEDEMTPEKWQKIRGLFEAAQEIAPEKREKFLENACGADADLKREVEKLLGSFDDAKSFMDKPAVAEAASMFEKKTFAAADKTTGEMQNGKFVAGTILGNRYRIIGLLGKGGMGEVFRAEDLKLKQEVALKFLPENLQKNEAALNRFIGEVRTARQVSHQNVCKVFDIGETNGKHFLSMEFVDGDDLSSLLRRIGRLPSDKAAEISRQICFGLHAIHEAGILHRDLKPANIIIDSKGRARITDFGIAGLEEEILNEEIRVGTPAYMSPEQITGREVTQRSDIYSLGLLLYEIFTGKQAIQADSFEELIEKHKTTAPTNPSTFVENIDPIVEKTINRCLEKNPTDRPKSALQVALALPGGNPLEAAIAAGETPSPEMVAAAPKKGALNPKLALGLLLTFAVVFILLSLVQQRNKIFNVVPPEKPPEVLAERSRGILEKFGYADASADSVYRFQENLEYAYYADSQLKKNKMTHSEIRKILVSGQASVMNFLYRQSPDYLQPAQSGIVTEFDPPLNAPNMVNVKLDQHGRLIEFIAVPPFVSGQTGNRETDWNALFAEAGLDISKFEQIESNRTPPVFADERRAWEKSPVDRAEIPLRIEAAGFQGKPVFFRITAPWNEAAEATHPGENFFRKIGVILILSIYGLVIVGSILLARHNLKVGRGDLRGAVKLMIFLFSVLFAGRLIYADHIPTVWGELAVIYQPFAVSLILTLFVGLMYIALEPFVRRYWSELLISWNRLLAGDFRDPLIGRDALFGLLLGMGHTVGIFFGDFLYTLVTNNTGALSSAYPFEPINGFPGIIYSATNFLVNAMSSGFVLLFVLLGFFMLTKRKNLSVFLIFLLMFILQGLIFVLTGHWIYVFAAIFNAFCFAIALSRFGLVGIISFFIGFYMSYHSPMTHDSSSLYFPNTVVSFVLIFSLAVYAFYISIAGQRVFSGKILEEESKNNFHLL